MSYAIHTTHLSFKYYSSHGGTQNERKGSQYCTCQCLQRQHYDGSVKHKKEPSFNTWLPGLPPSALPQGRGKTTLLPAWLAWSRSVDVIYTPLPTWWGPAFQ
eukprot:scaffold304868_cov21-Tisochrysis_lutea.AAC.1